MKNISVRNLDHVVLPVPSLEITRERFTQLGFTVAPDARHSFGSENACVFFGNGTFIEPLAIGHRETVEADMIKGNNFLRRDAAYRFRHGDDGFSCVVFAEPKPKKVRKQFKKAGYETGKIVVVKRPGVKVHIAFIMDQRAPDCTFFMCERPDGPAQFAPELTSHDNGAMRIARVTMHEHLPEDFQYYIQTASEQREVRSHSFGMDMVLPNATLTTLNDDGMKAFYGAGDLPKERGLRAMAFDVEVQDLQKTQKLLQKNKVDSKMIGGRLVVEPASGQGAILAFVEA